MRNFDMEESLFVIISGVVGCAGEMMGGIAHANVVSLTVLFLNAKYGKLMSI